MSCQASILSESRLQLHIYSRQVFLPIRSTCRWEFPTAEGRTAQNFKQRPATKSPRAFRAHRKTRLLGHAMGLFSAGFPTGVNGAPNASSSNPTNRLPTSHEGQATKATGRLHCYICNFLRVAHASLMCNSRTALFLAPFRDFLRISTTRSSCNSSALWKGNRICEKAPRTRANTGFAVLAILIRLQAAREPG